MKVETTLKNIFLQQKKSNDNGGEKLIKIFSVEIADVIDKLIITFDEEWLCEF